MKYLLVILIWIIIVGLVYFFNIRFPLTLVIGFIGGCASVLVIKYY